MAAITAAKKLSTLLRCQRVIIMTAVNVRWNKQKQKSLSPSSTCDDLRCVAFDPDLQEDDSCAPVGIGIRAELSRRCRKQEDCGYY